VCSSDLVGSSTPKALEWLLAVAPGVKRLFVPYCSTNDAAILSLRDLQQGAAKLNIEPLIADVHTLPDLQQAMAAMPAGVDAIWLLNSHFLVSHVSLFVDAAIKRKLPLASGTGQFKAGVPISYGQDHYRTGMQAASLADKILKGIPVADLPVESADFVLAFNLKTAAAIGLHIPDEALRQADFIIR